jgi:predicted deacylase
MTTQFDREVIPVHTTASGARYEIDVFRYEPPQYKQTVYLQGGLHGVELTGIPVLYEFMRQIEQAQLPQRFICVPQSNPMGLDSQIMGIQTGYNNIHTNQQNCWNWNRIGQLRDEESQEGRWIDLLLTLAEPADIVLDLHTAGVEMAPHVYVHTTQVEYAQGLGIPHILTWETHSTSFSDTCHHNGKVALTFELSASRGIMEHDVERGLTALRRFFELEPPTEPSKVWPIKGRLKRWAAPNGGVLCWHCRAGDRVHSGDHIATLYTRTGKQELTSPYTGLLLLKNPIHAPHERQELAKFLIEK